MIGSNMQYIFDTYAWIEIFEETSKGDKALNLIDKSSKIVVADAIFAEIYSWAVRNDFDPGKVIEDIRKQSNVFPIYTNIWVEAAAHREKMRKQKKDFGQMDALLLAIQDATGATIVTGDPHFKGLKNVILL